ncbi:hypothetical protein L6475_01610 [Prevotella sp. E9-3]|uniref:hypothetical protein n=1 Tax=Prevotella sp. E9-3 TaxID=2913621 RepID=UPI001EDB55D8|nr:hypothetical protein [Prevotella sp. E9-3]UKK48690.1 hypothetical protein L6475_01610 [Prevotella sp. E9-3]
MKKQYQKPQTEMALEESEPLMDLSSRGRTVTFDTPETNGDASNAAARTYNVWDDDEV